MAGALLNATITVCMSVANVLVYSNIRILVLFGGG